MRWTAKRKHELIDKYYAGRTHEVYAALGRHGISHEEFQSWLFRAEAMGIDGLKVSKVARVG